MEALYSELMRQLSVLGVSIWRADDGLWYTMRNDRILSEGLFTELECILLAVFEIVGRSTSFDVDLLSLALLSSEK